LISTSTASEAVPDISRQVGSEAGLSLPRTALRLCTAAQDTAAAEIPASAPGRMKLQQLQNRQCQVLDNAKYHPPEAEKKSATLLTKVEPWLEPVMHFEGAPVKAGLKQMRANGSR